MKVVVDFGTCAGLGLCESLAPEFQRVEEAVCACPTGSLRIEP